MHVCCFLQKDMTPPDKGIKGEGDHTRRPRDIAKPSSFLLLLVRHLLLEAMHLFLVRHLLLMEKRSLQQDRSSLYKGTTPSNSEYESGASSAFHLILHSLPPRDTRVKELVPMAFHWFYTIIKCPSWRDSSVPSTRSMVMIQYHVSLCSNLPCNVDEQTMNCVFQRVFVSCNNMFQYSL